MTLFNVVVHQQLQVLLVQEEQRIGTVRQESQKAYQEQLKFQHQHLEQKLRARRLLVLQMEYLCSAALNLVLVLLLGLTIGLVIGTNIPDGALCRNTNVLCQWFRVRSPKLISP